MSVDQFVKAKCSNSTYQYYNIDIVGTLYLNYN